MHELIEHTKEFYENLSSLFYAMATADTNLMTEEKKKIKELVIDHWSFNSEDGNSQDIIFSKLKALTKKNCTSEEAFQEFKNFFLRHPEEFSDDIKSRILNDAESISLAFSKRNKSESVLSGKLYFLMEKA